MYGGSGKMGRGGGGGGGTAGKRNNIPAPPINRAAPTGRLSMGGGGPRGAAAISSSPSTSSVHVEESFSLVRENPLNFGMAIKLAPDLVEEIKRVEAQGGTARIKFDATAKNRDGNVINVGDKNFKFTWSREPGDLCDVYEERQSGEDGNGLLVESGGTWRKLNVERELDESTTNHLKRRSEEAERKLKSRKSIVLDPQNPSMKNQMKALAAAESNPWRNFKHWKEPLLKKPKSDPPSAGGPPKSVYKSGLSMSTVSSGKLSSGSPVSSQPDQHSAPAIPIGSANLKGNASIPDCAPTQNTNRIANSDKEMHSRLANSTSRDKSKHNRNTEAKPADLRSLMISVLLDHQSKGMSLKALEKAIGDAMPNSSRQMEPLLKQIAIYQAPGRYFLKLGVEMENFKKPPSQSGSSPEINHQQSSTPQKFDQLPVQDSGFPMETAANNEEQIELNSMPVHTMDTVVKIDILHKSPEHVSDKKVSENGLAGSASDSESDSESDNESDTSDSDSDSGSHSRSKSLSPGGSQSGSSSDSESDASSSSKQASDQEVDIMSDGEKESKQKLRDFDAATLKLPVHLNHQDNEPVDVGTYDKLEGHVADVIEIEKDSPEHDLNAGRHAINYSYPNKEGEDLVEAIRNSATDHQQERQVCDEKACDGHDSLTNDVVKHGQTGNHERLLKGKSKRCYDDKHSDERANRKKMKTKNSIPFSGTIKSLFGESPYNSSPEMPLHGPEKGPMNVMRDRTSWDGDDDPNSQTCFNQVTPTKSAPDSHQLGQRSFEAHIWSEAPSREERPGKHDCLNHGGKYFEQNLHTNENPKIQKAFNTEAESEDALFSENRPVRFSAEGVGDKHPTMTESHYRRPEMLGKIKEAGTHSNPYMGYPPKDNNVNFSAIYPVMNDQGRVLRREHSDLELGEFREPFHDETPAPKKKFERKSSFNQLDNRSMDYECRNSDFSRGKPSNKITADLGKLSPPNSDAVTGIPDGPSKRKVPERYIDDFTRPHRKSTRPLDQHHQSWGEQTEVGSQHNKVPEMSGKSRFAEAGTGQEPILEASGDTSRKVSVNSTEQQHDLPGAGQRTTKESKKRKPNMVGDSNGRQKYASLTGNNDGIKKKKESSLDDNNCSYTKFEKEEPELKGPINSASQYKEYVKEYQEKYESYCSLNKILEAYRNEFGKLGKDLEAYKGNDMKRYHEILEQMRASFRHCGERHKRQKKIFVVLFEELKHLKQMIKDYAATYKKG